MKSKFLYLLLVSILILASCGQKDETETSNKNSNELEGEITFWHSFTQGPRKEYIEEKAEVFMQKHPKVKIKIETFAWPEFHTKWTTGVQAGQVPDISTAMPNDVSLMIDANVLSDVDGVINDIGNDKFYSGPLKEGEKNGKHYSIPLYSHAQVMWYRKDLLKKVNEEVPKTWDDFERVTDKISKEGTFGISVPMGTGDMMATRFLNFYVRSHGEKLIKNGKADLTNKRAIDGINYWVNRYHSSSPKGSINFKVLDQATLFYQGKTAFDFNSGFQISGVKANSPDLLKKISAAPIPTQKSSEKSEGIETTNVPLVQWKHSKHKDISRAFIKELYKEDDYVDFLLSTPGGMLPVMKGVSDNPKYKSNETIKAFKSEIDMIERQISHGTAIGMEDGPNVEASILTTQNIIEEMFQEIVTTDISTEDAAKKAEDKLNRQFQIMNR
ncbi:ABC transporter substrate-binding protein [Mammaliicoccus sciuri]|uniref:ABC transporter substrate-binding protein n=1 Tax=Mammaliicoccus sciuri TaxID=1296 RepID=UPI001FB3402A|nr:sugar ABC transporter substrate-binding protein [Mammaliicoccus sciuri]MCJ0925133.1 sugar ABC transporter substrate-binding protein [Mammaliicoccus sciuri]UXV29582.1 sugar ABC transporter substrate-binding protein [Mammaliicoccus sciuri]